MSNCRRLFTNYKYFTMIPWIFLSKVSPIVYYFSVVILSMYSGTQLSLIALCKWSHTEIERGPQLVQHFIRWARPERACSCKYKLTIRRRQSKYNSKFTSLLFTISTQICQWTSEAEPKNLHQVHKNSTFSPWRKFKQDSLGWRSGWRCALFLCSWYKDLK